jgi:hypothetical protein
MTTDAGPAYWRLGCETSWPRRRQVFTKGLSSLQVYESGLDWARAQYVQAQRIIHTSAWKSANTRCSQRTAAESILKLRESCNDHRAWLCVYSKCMRVCYNNATAILRFIQITQVTLVHGAPCASCYTLPLLQEFRPRNSSYSSMQINTKLLAAGCLHLVLATGCLLALTYTRHCAMCD